MNSLPPTAYAVLLDLHVDLLDLPARIDVQIFVARYLISISTLIGGNPTSNYSWMDGMPLMDSTLTGARLPGASCNQSDESEWGQQALVPLTDNKDPSAHHG